MTRHEFAKKCLKYNLPHIINYTPELGLEIFLLTVYLGVHITYKCMSYTNIKTYVQYLIVTYVSLIHKVLRILICTYMDRCNEMLYIFVLLLLNYVYFLILQRRMYTCIRDRINY